MQDIGISMASHLLVELEKGRDMPRVMEKVVPVTITTDEINCYATITRSCISGITALLRLNKSRDVTKGKHINPQIDKLREIKKWAESQYDGCVDREVASVE